MVDGKVISGATLTTWEWHFKKGRETLVSPVRTLGKHNRVKAVELPLVNQPLGNDCPPPQRCREGHAISHRNRATALCSSCHLRQRPRSLSQPHRRLRNPYPPLQLLVQSSTPSVRCNSFTFRLNETSAMTNRNEYQSPPIPLATTTGPSANSTREPNWRLAVRHSGP